MILIREFRDKDAFYRFLKDKVGVFFREAEERSFEGLNRVIYLEKEKIDPQKIHECARWACLHIFHNEDRYALSGTEAQIRKFCSCLVKSNRDVATEILESLIRYRKKAFRLQYREKILPLGIKTAIMGVLNVTPDSFSDGGMYTEPKKAVERAVKMVEEGAEIIDIGGESTRPGSQRVSFEEELRRVLPVLREVRKELPNVWISIDTYKAEVARICLEEGADIINDISGGTFDEEMFRVVSQYHCPYIMCHIKGRPEEWKSMPIVYEDVMQEIIEWFGDRLSSLRAMGYKGTVLLDPGIGFGKLPEHNVEILKRFNELKIFGLPTVVGVSRKSFIGLILEGLLKKKTQPAERLYGSLGALAYAVTMGACVVRVHDVGPTREFLAVLDSIRTYHEF
ncbi:dihydropteroate synthase [Thermocrinis albus DSM 14484]|uniref:Dihydropteroate synthase n=1 Tax=Thermocrinis albus (strain DSM 14484 / JCM 11386 / HI 11/12) TaxID=638303 RepID=D3SNY3_THEAH|nr:dihydropteroate synthase [Thermocrinis albus]ADC88870.1 dihydropteroate synthase [Thermocrinis albus DSM 14484]